MDDSHAKNLLNDLITHVIGPRNIALPRKYAITTEYLDEVLSVVDDTRDLAKLTMTCERNIQPEVLDVYENIAKHVTEITGFKCGKYTINSKPYKNLSTVLHCYCPKLKLNLYFETFYKVQQGNEFVYYDLSRDGSYARIHKEFHTIHECIRSEHKIIEYECDVSVITMTSEERRKYVLGVISEYTKKYPYVGGYIDPNFPQDEPADESDEDSDEESRRILNTIIGQMVYSPHNFDQFGNFRDDLF
jgi:hypothetical protein